MQILGKGKDLELTHDSEGRLPGSQQQVAVGHCLSDLQLLIHNPEEVHRTRSPEVARLVCLGLPLEICLQEEGECYGLEYSILSVLS